MALGATRSQVLWLILLQGTRLALAGVVVGGLGAVFAGRLLQSMLYGVSATDPVAFGVAAAILLAVALAANAVRGLRFNRGRASIDPAIRLD
jgi:putative ABC transport system permease protein